MQARIAVVLSHRLLQMPSSFEFPEKRIFETIRMALILLNARLGA
jgi:hypothetical protein